MVEPTYTVEASVYTVMGGDRIYCVVYNYNNCYYIFMLFMYYNYMLL